MKRELIVLMTTPEGQTVVGKKTSIAIVFQCTENITSCIPKNSPNNIYDKGRILLFFLLQGDHG